MDGWLNENGREIKIHTIVERQQQAIAQYIRPAFTQVFVLANVGFKLVSDLSAVQA